MTLTKVHLEKILVDLMSCWIKQSKSNMPLRGFPEGQILGLVTSSTGNRSWKLGLKLAWKC